MMELKNVHPVLKRLFGVPLISPPVQEHIPFSPIMSSPFSPIMSSAQERLVDVEVAEMLRKGAITLCTHQTGEIISNLFLVRQKDGGHRPVINLKDLNQFVPYQHFKM